MAWASSPSLYIFSISFQVLKSILVIHLMSSPFCPLHSMKSQGPNFEWPCREGVDKVHLEFSQTCPEILQYFFKSFLSNKIRIEAYSLRNLSFSLLKFEFFASNSTLSIFL